MPVNPEYRDYFKKFCSVRELNQLVLIRQKIIVADQAIQPVAIPENAPRKKYIRLLDAALDYKARARSAEQNWWRKAMQKYDLPVMVSVDLKTREFYGMKQI